MSARASSNGLDYLVGKVRYLVEGFTSPSAHLVNGVFAFSFFFSRIDPGGGGVR